MFGLDLTEPKNRSAEKESPGAIYRRSPTARGMPMAAKLHGIVPKIVNRREKPLASSRLMVDDMMPSASAGDSKEALTTSKERPPPVDLN